MWQIVGYAWLAAPRAERQVLRSRCKRVTEVLMGLCRLVHGILCLCGELCQITESTSRTCVERASFAVGLQRGKVRARLTVQTDDGEVHPLVRSHDGGVAFFVWLESTPTAASSPPK